MRRRGLTRLVRRLGITLLILGLAHVPLPTADFHVIGHEHGEGQACLLHDHLLRWHASDAPSEGAVLHFHWALLAASMPEAEAQGPAIHADSPEPFDIELSDDSPQSSFSAPGRSLVAKPLPILLTAFLPVADTTRTLQAASACRASTSRNFGTTFPPRDSLASRLQRWIC
jgi:hypothetical protein